MTALLKKLYNELLYVPRHGRGRVRERVMLFRVALSVSMILFCMAAMSLSAYAFFTYTAYSGVGDLQAASWGITVTAAEDILPREGVYTLDNTAGGAARDYTFTVTEAADATASVGYVRIVMTTDANTDGSVQEFYTQPIGSFLLGGVMTEDTDRQVRIRIPAGKQAQVSFVGEWGSCSKEPIMEESEAIEPAFAAAVQLSTTPATTTTTTTTTTATAVEETTTTTETTTTVATEVEASTTTTTQEDAE